jgi:exodeoxyribonuclease V alpha subunit
VSHHVLRGIVERVTFYNPHSGFTVAKLRRKGGETCVVGKMPPIQPGEQVECKGEWVMSPTHGRQFQVEEASVRAPVGSVAIQKYLGSGMIHGIGKVYAEKIVQRFGDATLEILDQTPKRLKEIPGIGSKRYGELVAAWQEHRTIRNVMLLLQELGISPAFAQRIFRAYGDQSVVKIRENPYRLAREVVGIGFRSADKVAKEMGMAHEAPERIEAGIHHTFDELAGEGHTCAPREMFVERAVATLELEEPQVVPVLDGMEDLVFEEGFVWRKVDYLSEKAIARELKRLMEARCALREVNVEKAVEWSEEQLGLVLAKNQRAAVASALTSKVQIITGGPGTGKSTITRAILAISRKLTKRIRLAAPTGRAAKRMSEICRTDARTIHALLEVDMAHGGFKRGHDLPVDADLIIIDEASMIDTRLMVSLVKAVPNEARLLLIGDINQLPSVGAGNVLRDLIASGKIPTAELNQIFRQAAGSKIITNAHRVNDGIFPSLESEEKGDFFFIEEEETTQLRNTVVDLVSRRVPARFGFDPLQEIQVLAPMKRGAIGTEQLNAALQQALNPGGQGLFRPGDKVMQVRNNYDKEVFNGDIGIVAAIKEGELLIRFDGRPITYQTSELEELQLAYAVSVHKYQGSECPCVIIPFHTAHFKLLQRNLLYTAITRARKLVILIGTKQAIGMAVNNAEGLERHTGLQRAMEAL